LPIHVRYAIDKKPYSYTKISINEIEAKNLVADYPSLYPADNNLQEDSWKKYVQTSKTFTSDKYNWRELIYQMALDYYKYGQLDIFS
jgi:hypothetical protein